jgi:hypothetical protein
VYGGGLPDMKIIKAWFDKFLATGSVLNQSGATRQSVSEEKVEEIHTAFQRSRDVISSVTPDMLERTRQEIEYRLDIIHATSGPHVEVY